MNTKNHVLIGAVVYEYIKNKYGIVLDKESFLRGNTCPDHSIAFLRPHRASLCAGMVRRKVNRLCKNGGETIDKRTSKKIGILCHYYSDFFCRAHNPKFGMSLKNHRRYEYELLRTMQENLTVYRGADYLPHGCVSGSAAGINLRMHLLLQEKPSQGGDYENELFLAVQACAELVLSVCTAIQAEPAAIPAA